MGHHATSVKHVISGLCSLEEALVRRRFFIDPVGVVSGIGFDTQPSSDSTGIRARLGLGDDPYLVYLGRIDPAKGAVEAWRFFDAYKRRRGGRPSHCSTVCRRTRVPVMARPKS